MPARPAIAVLGFRNLTGRSDTAWLAVALSEMLTTELGAGESLRTISGENISRVKVDLELADADSYSAETLARIRRNLSTDLVVLGSYVIVGDGENATLRVDIRLQDSFEGETLSVVSESGRAADLFDVVSRAGSRLRERLGVQKFRTSIDRRSTRFGERKRDDMRVPIAAATVAFLLLVGPTPTAQAPRTLVAVWAHADDEGPEFSSIDRRPRWPVETAWTQPDPARSTPMPRSGT